MKVDFTRAILVSQVLQVVISLSLTFCFYLVLFSPRFFSDSSNLLLESFFNFMSGIW